MNRLAVRIAERYLSQPERLLRSVFVAAAVIVAVITVVQLYLGPAPGRSMPAAFVPEPLWIPTGSISVVEDAGQSVRWRAYLGLPLGHMQFTDHAPTFFVATRWNYYLDSVRVSPIALAADICFFAVCLLALAAMLLRAFRRRLSRRRVHNLCVNCGYNLYRLTSDVCPECGTSVRNDRLWRHCRDATALYRAILAVAALQATCVLAYFLLGMSYESTRNAVQASNSQTTAIGVARDMWLLAFWILSIAATAVVWRNERRAVGFVRRRVPLAIACVALQVVTLWILFGLTALRIEAD